MAWTFDEKSPIYLQIAYRVKLKIASKELSMGQQLLPVREFAQEAGVNPNTVQRAFQEVDPVVEQVLTQKEIAYTIEEVVLDKPLRHVNLTAHEH